MLCGPCSSETGEEVCVRDVGIVKPVEGIPNHECLVQSEVVVHSDGYVICSRSRFAGKVEQSAGIVHARSVGAGYRARIFWMVGSSGRPKMLFGALGVLTS